MGSPGKNVVNAVVVLSAILVPCMLGHAAPASAQSSSAGLSAADVAVACAPTLTVVPDKAPVHPLRVIGSQMPEPRTLFGIRDLIVISGGTSAGLQINQQFATKREYDFGTPAKGSLETIHTSGWLRIVAVNEATAIAQIEQACDGVYTGDYLEAFVPPAALPAGAEAAAGNLDFSSMARVIFGDEIRQIAGPGDFMMLDRAGAPLAPGTRVAVYRDLQTKGIPLVPIAEGEIVSMPNDAPLMRVLTSKDAVRSGDYVVAHKP